MRFPAAKTNDTLDVASLPPTDNTELNYRTRPFTPEQESQLTNKTLFGPALFIAPIGLVVSWLFAAQTLMLALLITAAAVFLLRALVAFLRGRLFGFDLLGFVLVVVAGALGWVFSSLSSQRLAYGIFFPLVVAGAGAFAVILARQVAYWMANHPRVEWATARKWEGFFPSLARPQVPSECPEALSLWLAPLFAMLAYGVGWLVLLRVEETPQWEYASVWGIVGFAVSLPLFVLLWNWGGGSWLSPRLTWRVSWQALKVWCTYNHHETKAAGVFRFPAPALRSIENRRRVIYAVLIAVTAGTVACLPSFTPAERPDNDVPEAPYILPHEEAFLQTFPEPEATQRRRELLIQRMPRPKAEKSWSVTFGEFATRLLIAAGLVTGGMYLLLMAIIFSTVGPILTRYFLALEAENGYAQSKASAWDVYVNRIIESADALEKKHYLLGFSIFGDYPVLLHQDILNQHYHMTGDTGASKTTLGMIPLATQMIARSDSTVVIIDLKGDMSLFETVRKEAESAKAEFRWFSSEPGKTSFIFNPFLQSHLSLLTPEQRTESLLQAMSLDYGTGYGRSYFTAMNEVVLKNLLRAYNIRSFKDLEGYLADPASYKDLGERKDFEQARHLAAIVNRLAGMFPLNQGISNAADQQEAQHRAMDAMDVLHRPQVIYFYLSSPQEPIGAPSVAKLFLWALFSAAARKPPRENRVYVFVDEFQQIITDSVKLVFEQIRGQGVTMVVAHQTAGQLHRQGSDLSETVESCTAVKQVFRASDLQTIKQLEEASGQAVYHTLSWAQPIDPGIPEEELPDQLSHQQSEEGMVEVTEQIGPRLDRNTIIQISANQTASFVRFTSSKGYTQFAGYTTPIVSMFTMPEKTHTDRLKAPWPTAPGTVMVPYPSTADPVTEKVKSSSAEPERGDEWDDRLRRGLVS